MHARDTIELAGLLSFAAPAVVLDASPISFERLGQYWAASKCRFDRWSKGLRGAIEPKAPHSLWSKHRDRDYLRDLLEEVLTSEVLTRTWGAILTAHDARQGQSDGDSIGRGVAQGHREARARVLALISKGPGVAAEDALALSRLRRSIERWSDLLLARIGRFADVGDYAFDRRRALDIAQREAKSSLPESDLTAAMSVAALRVEFPLSERAAPNGDLNLEIAKSILGCLTPAVFDDRGQIRGIRQSAFYSAASDTPGGLPSHLDSPSSLDLSRATTISSPLPTKSRFRRGN